MAHDVSHNHRGFKSRPSGAHFQLVAVASVGERVNAQPPNSSRYCLDSRERLLRRNQVCCYSGAKSN